MDSAKECNPKTVASCSIGDAERAEIALQYRKHGETEIRNVSCFDIRISDLYWTVMLNSLYKTSSFFFYFLGASLFLAFLFVYNKIAIIEMSWWLQRADLPFAIVALTYGGTSLYRSLHTKEEFSPMLAILIALPIVAFFIFLVVLNFWETLGMPQGEMFL